MDPSLKAAGVELGNGYVLFETSDSPDAHRTGTRLELRKAGVSEPVAVGSVTPAEEVRELSLASQAARASALLSIEPAAEVSARDAFAYCAFRRARMMNRANLLVRSGEASGFGAASFLPCEGDLLTQRTDFALHQVDQALVRAGRPVAAPFRAAEVEETASRWLATGPRWGFFKAVHDRTLTRQQYVYALMNIYQFVRHTTRIVARCIAYSPTTEMRTHFIHHMNGEVNHELIIERDLAFLGEDVAFMRDHMAPNAATHAFIANQEHLIGYREDPVLLMASPVAAEGVTAHLTEDFVQALAECLRAEGLEKPEKAMKFFVSHMHTDGGEDGHWEMTIAFLGKCLVDETKHQMFMRALRSAMNGTEGLYNSFVTDIPRWGSAKTLGSNLSAQTALQA